MLCVCRHWKVKGKQGPGSFLFFASMYRVHTLPTGAASFCPWQGPSAAEQPWPSKALAGRLRLSSVGLWSCSCGTHCSPFAAGPLTLPQLSGNPDAPAVGCICSFACLISLFWGVGLAVDVPMVPVHILVVEAHVAGLHMLAQPACLQWSNSSDWPVCLH